MKNAEEASLIQQFLGEQSPGECDVSQNLCFYTVSTYF